MQVRRYLRFLMIWLGLIGLAWSMSRATGTSAAGEGSEKISPELLQRLQAEGQVDFFIRFSEQSDLSAAEEMGWSERGWYVYNTLTETAQRSQVRAKAYLQAQGVTYRSFIAGNELYVSAGNLEHASSLARLAEVAELFIPPRYTIAPDEAVKSIVTSTWAGDLLAKHAEITVLSPDTISWGVDNTNGNEFWTTFNIRGEGILVANIDTGVLYTHEALYTKYACYEMAEHDNCWYDPDGSLSIPTDNIGHGTHTMGTMAGDDPDGIYQIGMAPEARWIACQGCDTVGCEAVDLAACADWILAPGENPENRPHIVNNSWGSDEDGSTWYLDKVNAWRAAGIFPAFSAGNEGPACDTLGDPGSFQESFASAAHDKYEIEYTSGSRGPSFWGHEPYTKPNISAPGVAVYSSCIASSSYYCIMNGTSMASPHSAGAVALLWACNPDLIGEIDTTFELLQNTTRMPRLSTCGTPPDGEGNYSFGYGYLDVWEAGLETCGGGSLGILSGHVYDALGNPISGAVVKATSAEMTTQRITDAGGAYSMGLLMGSYEVTASMNGYADKTLTGIDIAYHQITVVDIHLSYLGLWTEQSLSPCSNMTRFDAEYYPDTGLVYILGGRYVYKNELQATVDTTIGRIFAFDPLTGICSETGAIMPIPVSNYTISLLEFNGEEVLCTFGGRTSTGAQTLAVQCYNPVNNTVDQVTDLPADPYTDAYPGAQVVYNNQVYLFGGIELNASTPVTNLAHTFRYDPISDTFTRLGDLNLARGYIQAAVVDGQIFAFGGDVYDGASTLTPQSIAEVLVDPTGSATWDDTAVADLPMPAGEGRAFGFERDSGYQLAGKIAIAALPQYPGASYEVITYNPLANTYDLNYPNLNIARRNHAAVFVSMNTPEAGDGLPGMWVLGGFCTGGACGGDLQPYGVPEFFPVYLVKHFYIPIVLNANSR